jgi:hypothetical protein
MQPRFRIVSAAILAVSLFVAGCSKHPRMKIAVARLKTSLVAAPSNALKRTRFTFTAKDSSRHYLSLEHVTVDLTMPTMMMPPNVIHLMETSPGIYQGVGTFTMAGDWSGTVNGVDHGKHVNLGSFKLVVGN